MSILDRAHAQLMSMFYDWDACPLWRPFKRRRLFHQCVGAAKIYDMILRDVQKVQEDAAE